VVDDEPLEEQPVLLVHRPVEPELVRHARDVLLGRGLAGGEPGRVGGQQEEEDVRDQRHSQEEDAGPEESSGEVAEHVSGIRWTGRDGRQPPLPGSVAT
jgi:hypothetical protein